ncbi:Wadjet anti-phage system protein JetA family protein [Uliginosibacterium sp. sgz301328]|uniref:Wadjet anti-phage system protein JetA family protein n=1 Tax=Uliginosibacterium sp. sgz301328 TaxID=3243764 RepID=UPI00359E4765
MNLFDRLPPTLFAALTGRNNRRMWELLCRLADRFFSPESVPDYADGYLLDQVIKEIERWLRDQDWEEEDGTRPTTPLPIQAAGLVTRLAETGWLVKEQVGLKTFISMRPTVMRFFEALQQFATEGPQHIGGNIQLIYSQLQSVQKDPRGQAAGFASAARLCAQLLNSLNATTLRARDLMKEIAREDATSVFIRRFFSEHIADIYVRDFKQLRTENHPLSLRYEIIEVVTRVTTDDHERGKLLAGYAEIAGARPGEEEAALERDVERFRRLADVERFLERMDRVMESATHRALAVISYRLRASDRIEAAIDNTAHVLRGAQALNLDIEGRLLSPTSVVSEQRMTMPTPPPTKPVRHALRKAEPTPHQRAMHQLRQAMIANRDMSPIAIKRFVEATLAPGQTLAARDFPATTVKDAVAFLALVRLAAYLKVNPRGNAANPLMKRLGFSAESQNSQVNGELETALFITPDFSVTRNANNAT